MKKITIYFEYTCPYCLMALHLLKKRGVEFEKIHTSKYPGGAKALKQKTGQSTVPQVFIDGELIGGYTELRYLDRNGGLNRSVS